MTPCTKGSGEVQMKVDAGTRLRVNTERVAAKVIDGEAIVINLTNGRYYSMIGTGALVWSMLADGATIESIAETLAGRYGVDTTTCRSDVERLVDQLLVEQLLASTDEPAVAPAGPSSDDPATYEATQLEVYSDMENLLALAPPLPALGDLPWSPSDRGNQPA